MARGRNKVHPFSFYVEEVKSDSTASMPSSHCIPIQAFEGCKVDFLRIPNSALGQISLATLFSKDLSIAGLRDAIEKQLKHHLNIETWDFLKKLFELNRNLALSSAEIEKFCDQHFGKAELEEAKENRSVDVTSELKEGLSLDFGTESEANSNYTSSENMPKPILLQSQKTTMHLSLDLPKLPRLENLLQSGTKSSPLNSPAPSPRSARGDGSYPKLEELSEQRYQRINLQDDQINYINDLRVQRRLQNQSISLADFNSSDPSKNIMNAVFVLFSQNLKNTHVIRYEVLQYYLTTIMQKLPPQSIKKTTATCFERLFGVDIDVQYDAAIEKSRSVCEKVFHAVEIQKTIETKQRKVRDRSGRPAATFFEENVELNACGNHLLDLEKKLKQKNNKNFSNDLYELVRMFEGYHALLTSAVEEKPAYRLR